MTTMYTRKNKPDLFLNKPEQTIQNIMSGYEKALTELNTKPAGYSQSDFITFMLEQEYSMEDVNFIMQLLYRCGEVLTIITG